MCLCWSTTATGSFVVGLRPCWKTTTRSYSFPPYMVANLVLQLEPESIKSSAAQDCIICVFFDALLPLRADNDIGSIQRG